MSLKLDAGIGAPFTPDRREAYLEVKIEASDKSRSTTTTRNVCILVDTSTSMSDSKIKKAREGVRRVLDELNTKDTVSIVGFETRSNVIVPMTKWGTADQSQIYDSVVGTGEGSDYDGQLEADGGTDIMRGLKTAQNEFSNLSGPDGGTKEMVLLSDGRDGHDISEYEEVAQDINSDGISIIAAGIGRRYNEQVMLTLAQESGGEPFNLDDSDNIADFLRERIQEAGKVVHSNPRLQIETGSDFLIDPDEKAYFTEPQIMSKGIASIQSGVEIELPRLFEGGYQDLTVPVLGTPNETGVELHLADVSIMERGKTIVETTVTTTYEAESTKERVAEKRREVAKIVTEISDGDTTEDDIEKAIAEVEKEGWSKVAADLKHRLNRSDKSGGNIEITKEPVDPDEY
jgi:Ca-activated chloride channel family protein